MSRTPTLVHHYGGRIEARAGHDLDAAALEGTLHLGRDLRVLERHDGRQVLEQRDLAAHVVVVAGELDADRPGAHDDDRLRDRVRAQDVVAGHDARRRRHEARQRLHARARGQDDVAGPQDDLAARPTRLVRRGHTHLLRSLESAPATDVLDTVLLDQAVEALDQTLDDLVAPRGDDSGVHRGACHGDAQLAGVADPVVEVGRFEHRLGGDAADVQAGAADTLGPVIDERDLEAQLAGAEGG